MSVCNSHSLCKVKICKNSSSDMSQYKLIYFDLRAIAEPIRLIFAYAKVEFQDKRISLDEWPSVKSTLPLGKLPVLIDGDNELTQSSTIARYLAKKFELIPANDFDAARCDEVVDILSDLVNQWRPFILEQNVEEKASKKTSLLENVIPIPLKRIETFVQENGNALIVGSTPTWADLVLAHFLETFELTLNSGLLENYPNLKRLKDNIFQLPQIKEYVEKRGKFTMA